MRPRWRAALAGVLALIVATACAPAAGTPSPTGAPAVQQPVAVAPPSPLPAGAVTASPQPAGSTPTFLVGYGSPSGDFLMLWVGEEEHIFEHYGVHVESRFTSGNQVVDAVIGGDVQSSMTGGQVVAGAVIAGAPLVTAATFIDHLTVQIVGAKGITQPEQLRGKRVSTSGVGTVPDFAARRALRSWGLEPDTDVTLLGIGPPPQQLTALENGAVDAAALTYPTTAIAIQMGYPVIADTFDIGGSVASTGLVVRQDLAESQPDLVTNVLRGFLESRAYILQHPDIAKQVLGDKTQVTDPAILDATFNASTGHFKADPLPTVEQMQSVLDDMQALVPGANTANAASMIDDTFVKRLEQDGTVAKFAAAQ